MKWAKTMERWEETGNAARKNLSGIWEAVCMKGVVSELGRPYLSPKGKEDSV